MDAVLPVEDVEFDPNVWTTGDVSQMTAEQYLSWVRCQASQLPEYKRANVVAVPERQSQYMPQVEEVLICPSTHLPDEEWELDILHSFSELRLSLYKLSTSENARERKEVVPQMKDVNGWIKFCLGDSSSAAIGTTIANNIDPIIVDDKAEAAATLKRKRQLAKQLGIAMDDNHIDKEDEEENDDDESSENGDEENTEYPDENTGLAHYLPGCIPEWTGSCAVVPTTSILLQFDQVLTQKVFCYLVDWLEDAFQLSSQCNKWIYGLLARLEKPVCQNTVAIIRQLYRRCCNLRFHLNLDSESFDSDLAGLNILISITGSYFGQGEEYVAFNQNHTEVIRDVADEDEEEDWEEEEGEIEFEEVEPETEPNEKRVRIETVANRDNSMELEEGECN